MTKDDIITLPNPKLREKSAKIVRVDEQIKSLISQMQDAVLDWESDHPHEAGVAIVAIQVAKPLKLILIRQDDDKGQPQFEAIINPKIIRREGPLTAAQEGCLSVPHLYGLVSRHAKVKVAAENLEGEPIRIKARGFLARVLQHEIDHLDGKLFIDQVKNNQFYKLNDRGNYVALNSDEINQHSFLR